MVGKIEYDFLNWKSFPSSLKLTNKNPSDWVYGPYSAIIPIIPSSIISVKVQVKQENVIPPNPSHVLIGGWNGEKWIDIPAKRETPFGTFDWASFDFYNTQIYPDTQALRVHVSGGGGRPETPGITWFDDLRIYRNDVLIYSNDFSNWAPIIIPTEIITGVVAIKFIK